MTTEPVGISYDEKALERLVSHFLRFGDDIAPYAQSAVRRGFGSFVKRGGTFSKYVKARVPGASDRFPGIAAPLSRRRGTKGDARTWVLDGPESSEVRKFDDVGAKLSMKSAALILMHKGGSVRPKRGKFMTLHTRHPDVRTASGRVKKKYRNLGRYKGNPNYYVYKDEATGELWVMHRMGGKNPRQIPVAKLVTETKHEKKLDLAEPLKLHEPEFLKRVDVEMQKFLNDKKRNIFE